ncbi:MAG: hypothetical protein D3917_01345 [Candidatus Electrothrix sp. AX5]|jgi:hypothetical protein|nr:hypothetical protein [Candidatus Electrothrix sp. AX5]
MESNAINKFTLLLFPCLCLVVFFQKQLCRFFSLTAERKIIINCAYTHIAVCLSGNCIENELKENTEYLLSAVAVTFPKL